MAFKAIGLALRIAKSWWPEAQLGHRSFTLPRKPTGEKAIGRKEWERAAHSERSRVSNSSDAIFGGRSAPHPICSHIFTLQTLKSQIYPKDIFRRTGAKACSSRRVEALAPFSTKVKALVWGTRRSSRTLPPVPVALAIETLLWSMETL